MTPAGPWCLLLFLLAFLDLSANLAAFSAESSLLSSGLRIQDQVCGGLWSCAQLFCRLANDSALTVTVPPLPRERSAECSIQGLRWLWRWSFGQCAVLFLLLASLFQGCGLGLFRGQAVYGYVFLAAAYVCLILAYLFALLWVIEHDRQTSDQRPVLLGLWNGSLSVGLLLALAWADWRFLFQPNAYQELQ